MSGTAHGVTDHDRALLHDVIRDAGELARSFFARGVRHWNKAPGSPVSEADLAVNAMLQQRLMAATPDYGWLSEESADDLARLGYRRLWVVDPIDGTRSFIEGRPDWSVSVALVEEQRPVMGALIAPMTDELFFAESGAGAHRNGKELRVSMAPLVGGHVAGSRLLLDRLGETGGEPFAVVPKIGSLALRFARVADATLTAAVASDHSHDWDLAAADLIVHEAGGVVTTLHGEPVRYNNASVAQGILVAAGPASHRDLLDRFAQAAVLPR